MGTSRNPDGFQHAIGSQENIIVPESQDAKALRRHPFVTRFVSSTARMLASIDFHNQARLLAEEVCSVGSNGTLSPELQPGGELSSPQTTPERPLGVSAPPP
jgi:hypothetical protein